MNAMGQLNQLLTYRTEQNRNEQKNSGQHKNNRVANPAPRKAVWVQAAWEQIAPAYAGPAHQIPFRRNKLINRAYAEMYQSDPVVLKWAGMAAFASHSAGSKMGLLRLGCQSDKAAKMLSGGVAMILLSLFGLFLAWKRKLVEKRWFLRILSLAIVLPYLANSCGWILAEMGRQPWVVYGQMKTEMAISPAVSAPMVLISLVAFCLLYVGLAAADIFLMAKYAQGNSLYQLRSEVEDEAPEHETELLLDGAY